jgi:peptidoglycan/LPS O-acetylase OafA/YrhL
MTFAGVLDKNKGIGQGFDALRLALASLVVVWHSIGFSYGGEISLQIWRQPLGAPFVAVMPAFFAVSGFLVIGSAIRLQSLGTFLAFRALRIVPALAVEITISALLLGAALTTVPLQDYFTSHKLIAYFGSLIGRVRYELPGVFVTNPEPRLVNQNLWTIPPEILCYLFIAVVITLGIYRDKVAFLIVVFFLVGLNLYKDHIEGWVVSDGLVSVRHLVLCFAFGNLLYLWREWIPYNIWLFMICTVLALNFLLSPGFVYPALAAASYSTVFVGLTPLKLPQLVVKGDYSYGIYLFGAPIQQSFVYLCPGLREFYWNLLFSFPIIFLIAVISWNFVEGPALNLRRRFVRQDKSDEARIPFWKTFGILIPLLTYAVVLLRFSRVAALRPLAAEFVGEVAVLIFIAALLGAAYVHWLSHRVAFGRARVIERFGLER